MESITTLSNLLPEHYRVVFVAPFVISSIVTTFAGAFLTLDRTRTFRPLDNTQAAEPNKVKWRYEGGIGGTIIGFLCGVHVSTYLSLLIVNHTSSKLGEVQYLVIWLICGGILAILGSRWRIAVSVFSGLLGGFAIAVILSIMFHPGLVARMSLLAIFVVLLLLGCLLPFNISHRWCTRISTASIGGLGIVVTIGLYRECDQWANPWLVMAVSSWIGVRNALERGLTAGACLLLVVGIAVDYTLHLKVGENPDQRWDQYLAEYSKNLPHSSDRAGVFQPFASFWNKLSKKPKIQRPMRSAVGNKSQILLPPASGFLDKKELSTPPPAPPYRTVPGRKTSLLTKPMSPPTIPKYGDSDSSDDDDISSGPPKFRPWVPKRNSTSFSSSPTLYGGDGYETDKHFKTPSPLLKRGVIYSDDEEDVTTAASTPLKRLDSVNRDSPGWKPAFILKHEQEKERLSMKSSSSILGEGKPRSESPVPVSNSERSSSSKAHSGSGMVPITPSLIRAVDRINQAQRSVYGPSDAALSRPSPRSAKSRTLALDADFWNEVQAKAAETTQSPRASK